MTYTYTESATQTRTITHAQRIAVNIATDLKRIQIQGGRGLPTDTTIKKFQEEVIILLEHDVLKEIAYGFEEQNKWSWTLIYKVNPSSGNLEISDDPGGINFPGSPIGSFISFLSYNTRWGKLSREEQKNIENKILNKSGIERRDGEIPILNLTAANRNYGSGTLKVQRFFAA